MSMNFLSQQTAASRRIRMGFSIALLAGLVALPLGCKNQGGAAGSAGGSGGGPSLLGMVGDLTGNRRTTDMIEAGGSVLEAVNLDKDQQAINAYSESVVLAVSEQAPLTGDEALNNYVTMVGLALAEKADAPWIDVQFGVLESNQINAVSTPAGHVLITRGALRLMKDESELAGVLAHELTHVIKRHGVEALKTAKLTGGLTKAAVANMKGGEFQGLTEVGVDALLNKGFSREQELVADKEAVALCMRTGYDPAGLVRFLERLEQTTPQQLGLQNVMSTHPERPSRISALKKLVGNQTGAKLASRFSQYVR